MTDPLPTVYAMSLPGEGPRRPATRLPTARVPQACQDRFVATHFWLPLLAVVMLASWLQLGGGDQVWADRLYALQGHQWALQDHVVTEWVLHRAGRTVSAVAWVGVLAAWFVAWRRPGLASWRRPLGTLWLSVLLGVALVAWLKSWTNMDCPWDLVRYGGTHDRIGLFGLRPIGTPRGRCFPAGHASGGYAWMALYFLALATRPRWRWAGLSIGLGAGLVFGLAQQVRGAHFASHDLWTAAICWFSALAMYRWLLLRDPSPRPRTHRVGGAAS